jgi:TonB family protein
MKQSYLAVLSGIVLLILLGMSWCGRNPTPPASNGSTPVPTSTPVASLPPPATTATTPVAAATSTPSPIQTATPSPTPTPAPLQSPSAELKRVSAKVGPAVVLVTTFDATGKSIGTGTAFFATSDGRLITSWHLTQNAAYAVAKSADGKIRNVAGVVASAPALDLAVLKAETQTGVPSVHIAEQSKNDSTVAVVGSSLGKKQQPIGAVTITGRESIAGGDALTISGGISADATGTPLVNEEGEVAGLVAVASEANQPARTVVRPADALNSLLAQTHVDSPARWLAGANEIPSPTPKGKITYAPTPLYPERARNFKPPLFGSGRFRIVFDATGAAKEVQIIHSTGQPLLDQAAVDAFQKWKSTPGHEWSLTIPITFRQ